jgi:endonuclease-3
MSVLQRKAEKIAQLLMDNHPNPRTELNFNNDYELVVAVTLSAQTTDKKVNQVTPLLFQKYPNWKTLSNASVDEIIPLIRAVNFHKGKAERLVKAGKLVTEQFKGMLPRNMVDLMKIPGVARKSANVIMQELWDIAEGIVVDTHVTRVSNRLGITDQQDPVKIEKELMALIPKRYWRNFSGSLVLHGRYICVARKPKCTECFLNGICPSAFKD